MIQTYELPKWAVCIVAKEMLIFQWMDGMYWKFIDEDNKLFNFTAEFEKRGEFYFVV